MVKDTNDWGIGTSNHSFLAAQALPSRNDGKMVTLWFQKHGSTSNSVSAVSQVHGTATWVNQAATIEKGTFEMD